MKKLFILISLMSSISFGATYYVDEVQTTELQVKDVTRELVISSVGELGEQVVPQAEGADFILVTKVLKLGETYIITIAKTQAGKSVYAAKIKAQNVESMDESVLRLVRSILQKTNLKEDVRIGEMNQKEKEELSQRRESRAYTYFAFGPFFLAEMDTTKAGYNLALGRYWEVSTQAMVKLTAEGTFLNENGFGSVMAGTLGANYYFNDKSTSPLIGGDIGYGVAAKPDVDTAGGFTGAVHVGVLFFRTATTQMELLFRYVSILNENEYGHPGTYGVRLGVLY